MTLDGQTPGSEASLWERIRAFWDFLVLFSGISTATNLSRTRKDPVQSRGMFLFRRRKVE
jgi:hypothetical protein